MGKTYLLKESGVVNFMYQLGKAMKLQFLLKHQYR